MVTLCLDFGNTLLKAGIIDGDSFKEEIVLPDDDISTLKEITDRYKPQKSILSSVVNHNADIESFLSGISAFHKLSTVSKLPFTTPVSKPLEIGADRLALAAAAVHFFPGKNNLVIGMGTCITYNFINQYHEFLGGSISPGMNMRFRSMHEFTAKLPLVNGLSEIGTPFIGYDTKTNLESGVVNGILCELEGIITKYNDKYENFNGVLTGGNSAFFASQVKKKIFADSNFLFKGLYALSELNNCPD